MKNLQEIRTQASAGFEFRTVFLEVREDPSEDRPRRVAGLGPVYEREEELWPGFYETIKKDAFKESVERERGRSIKSFFNHNPNFVLATTDSDPPLIVKNTVDGVVYEAEIPDTSYGHDLYINLARGNVQGSSFAFTISAKGDRWWEDEDGNFHREIRKGEIYELGPVTDPAYLSAPANLRSAQDVFEKYREALEQQKKTEQKIKEQRKADVGVVKNILLGGKGNAKVRKAL